jgi:hypothetical protein
MYKVHMYVSSKFLKAHPIWRLRKEKYFLEGQITEIFWLPFFHLTADAGLNKHALKPFRNLLNFRGVICT